MYRIIMVCFSFLFFMTMPLVVDAEIVTTSDDQFSVSLTIYNSDLALVRDQRKIVLPEGENTLAFKEISSHIMPETALLKGGRAEVIEQNFEFDLLSPMALLQKYVGKEVKLFRSNQKTGEKVVVEAKVLSTANGVVLQIDDHIETEIDGRIIYPDVPANLRERPTLTMLIANESKGQQNFELSYLTKGLSWKADYVAELNAEEDRIDLTGWVTLTNNSGTSYRDSRLQLVAGEVHRAKTAVVMPMAAQDFAEAMPRGVRKKVSEEPMFEYHLYTVERPTTILENQSKQIALLQENNGLCRKELLLRANDHHYYWAKIGEISKKQGIDVYLEMKNDKASNFGLPKPAGIVRVYKKDSAGFSQFIGEDFIDHTPENELIRIKMGRSFDVTADRIQTDFALLKSNDKNKRIYESEYEITLKNGKDKEVAVKIEEEVPGDWQILSESFKHEKESASLISWVITVPQKGSSKLNYRVRTEM